MTWLSTDLTVVAGNVALAFALALHRVIVITLSFAFVILASFRVTFRLSKLALVEEVLSLAFVLLTTLWVVVVAPVIPFAFAFWLLATFAFAL